MKALAILSRISQYKKLLAVSSVSAGLLVGAAISFVSLPILSRLYAITDFGIYGLCISIISIISTICSLRLDQALLVAREEERSSLMTLGLFLTISAAAIAGFVSSFYSSPFIGGAIATGILSNGVLQLIYSNLFRDNKYYWCGGLNLLRTMSLVGPQLLLPLLFQTHSLLYGIYAQGLLVGLPCGLLVIATATKEEVDLSVWRNYRDFIKHNTPHAVLNSFSHNMPYYFLVHFGGAPAAGYYAIVDRVLKTPIFLFSQVIRQSFIKRFSSALATEKKYYAARRYSRWMLLAGAPFFLSLILLPDPIYVHFFGSHWAGIAPYFTFMAIGYWAVFSNPPISALIIALRRSDILLRQQIIELCVKAGLMAVLGIIFHDAKILIGMSIALITYNFLISYKIAKECKIA